MSDAMTLPYEALAAGSAQATIAWLGTPPQWLTSLEPAPFEIVPVSSAAEIAAHAPSVVHVDGRWATRISELRRAVGSTRIVLDLSNQTDVKLGRRAAAEAARADLVLLGSLGELRQFRTRHPELAATTTVFRTPLDLARWAPEATMVATRSREVKRLRRLHRLAGPIVLYAGPYTEEGGLARVIAAVSDIHTRNPDVRLVTLPVGRIDSKYLDRCERAALGLGHHGIVEWTLEPDELPLWFALAAVVCAPHTEPSASPIAAWAAAAGRPFVGSNLRPSDELVADGVTGFLLETPIDPSQLVAVVEALVMDPDEANRIGAATRERAELELSPEAALWRLAGIWVGSPAHGEHGGRPTGV